MIKTKFPKLSFVSQPMEDIFTSAFKTDPNFDLSLKNTSSTSYDHGKGYKYMYVCICVLKIIY